MALNTLSLLSTPTHFPPKVIALSRFVKFPKSESTTSFPPSIKISPTTLASTTAGASSHPFRSRSMTGLCSWIATWWWWGIWMSLWSLSSMLLIAREQGTEYLRPVMLVFAIQRRSRIIPRIGRYRKWYSTVFIWAVDWNTAKDPRKLCLHLPTRALWYRSNPRALVYFRLRHPQRWPPSRQSLQNALRPHSRTPGFRQRCHELRICRPVPPLGPLFG